MPPSRLVRAGAAGLARPSSKIVVGTQACRRLGCNSAPANVDVQLWLLSTPVEQTAPENPCVSSTAQYITLTHDGQLLAEATIRSATHRPSVHALVVA